MPLPEPVRLVEVDVKRIATGGEAVGHLDDGRVVFVQGALPGETVRVEVIEQKKRFARAVTHEVLVASDHRIEARCVHARVGECGGCDWQSVRPASQTEFKLGIVIEQLERLGKIEAPSIQIAPTAQGHRTTVRCAVTEGRAGYRARRNTTPFVAEACVAAHPLLQPLVAGGDFGDATEVTLRCGAVTGEIMVITNGAVGAVTLPPDTNALIVNAADPGSASISEEVARRRWRISANSFFQTSTTGAEALVSAVTDALDGMDGDIVDLYAGVGLLGGAAAGERLRMAVESNPSSIADAQVNLGSTVEVVSSKVERWSPVVCDAVIADPARRGLTKDGVAVIEQTKAARLVLVSCDPASLGRDAALLIEQGWRYDQGALIDMFPDTSRIEVVSTFSR